MLSKGGTEPYLALSPCHIGLGQLDGLQGHLPAWHSH